MFMPIFDNILACFEDDTVEIWKYTTFESMKQFQMDKKLNTFIKTIAFNK